MISDKVVPCGKTSSAQESSQGQTQNVHAKWWGRTISSWPTWLSTPAFETLRLFDADIKPRFHHIVGDELPILGELQAIVTDYTRLNSEEVEKIIRAEIFNVLSPSSELQKKLDEIKASKVETLDLHGLHLFDWEQDFSCDMTLPKNALNRWKLIASLLPELKILNLTRVDHRSNEWVQYIKIISEQLPKLEELDLSCLNLKDDCVEHIAKLSHLKRLIIRPDEIWSDIGLTTLGLQNQAKTRLKELLPNLEIIDV